jgi:Bacterial Ig-like domain (group 1)
MKFLKYLSAGVLALGLASCGGGGGSAGTTSTGSGITPTPTPTTPTVPTIPTVPTVPNANANVATIRINSSATSLNADGSSLVTFTVFALTSGNASVTGATIDLAATNGVILSSPSVVTTATGATVTMIAVSSDQTKRISALTASCAGCTASPATAQINVIGASVAVTNSGATSLIVRGATTALNATVKDVFGVVMQGVTVSFAATDPAILGLNAPTGVTNSSGIATVTVAGLTAGTASINVSALGNAKSQAYTSGLGTTVLAVTSPANNFVMLTGAPGKLITVSAPGASTLTFTTTRGTFGNGTTSQNVAVVNNTASATLTSVQAGTATITIGDNLLRSADLTLVVSPPVTAVNKILLNASQTTLPIANASGSQSSLTLTARAVFFDGVTDQSVVNVPIEFSMAGGPGAGEFLAPALAFTDSAGNAVATFTAGTSASIPNGIVISAKVQGTAVQTGTSPSSNNALLTIGGQALSVAFGPASVLGESSDKTLYIQAYSVQVTDANNNPVPNKVVTLRMRPVAFSLGGACTVTETYCSEDWNANGSLEAAAEDGVRISTTTATAGSCPSTASTVATALTIGGIPPGTPDRILTPPNSDGGSVPTTVTTDASGIAAFNLTYLKGSALWVINKLTATVSSNGTETGKSTIFRLAQSVPDFGPPCALPPSPYSY